ncbi:MAG: hypothetical protein QNJ62_12905 [Methyloceanibacter sp.]|nr:hypothetical protein [Methyloceanibacter sp.]
MSESAAGLAASRALRRAYEAYLAYRVKQSLFALWDAVERKRRYDPNQPRAPAGNPDGGQWTDGGGSGSGGSGSTRRRPSLLASLAPGSDLDSDRLFDNSEQLVRVAQGSRRVTSPSAGTPAQRMIRNKREGEAIGAIQRVQQIEPGWRPRERSLTTNSIRGEIARAEARRDEAIARWRDLTTREPRSVIEAFRRGHGLETFNDITWPLRKNTVAHCTFDDQTFFGVNSKEGTNYTRRDDYQAKKMRGVLLEKHPEVMNADNIGQMPNNALFHAEAICLFRAARGNGGTLEGKRIQVTVDREMCKSCKEVLPLVGLELGNPTVIFRDLDGTIVRAMRNGTWLK